VAEAAAFLLRYRPTRDEAVEPFRIRIPQDDVDDLRDRLARTRWPDQLPGAGWDYGIALEYVQDLAEYWRTGYDWRVQEQRLNAFPQFTTTVDGQRVHFLHVRSAEPADQARAARSACRSGDPTRTSFPSGSVSLASRIPHGQSSATDPAGMTLSTSPT
jgi:hypothetical protein